MDRARVPAPCPGGLSRSGEQPDKQQEPAASGRPQGAKAAAGTTSGCLREGAKSYAKRFALPVGRYLASGILRSG